MLGSARRPAGEVTISPAVRSRQDGDCPLVTTIEDVTQPSILVVQNDDPVGRLGVWLTEAGLRLDVRHGTSLPPDLDGYAGLVVMGGAMGVTDDALAPWLPAVRSLLRAAVSDEVPVLAICLGAQLLAVAHGGRVEPNPDGPELGAQLVAKRGAAASDPLFGGVPITPDVLQWHYDAITTLPAGAIQLASSPACDQQAFRLGRLAWGIQFHIETTPDMVRAWAKADAPRLAEFDLDSIVSRAVAAHEHFAEVWAPFAHAFADVVRDPAAVRSHRGVATSAAAPVTDPAAIRAALAAEANTARTVLPVPGLRPPGND